MEFFKSTAHRPSEWLGNFAPAPCRTRRKATDRMRAVAGMFDLDPVLQKRRSAAGATCWVMPPGPGEILLITGPSGAGKSTLLRQMLTRIAGPICRLERVALRADAALVDCFPQPLEQALEALSRAGLSQGDLFLRTPRQLSEGERFRYRLARFYASDEPLLVADEFAAMLDRETARIVAWQLGRFVCQSAGGNRPRSAILATSHEDLAEDLQPTRHVRLLG